MTPKQYAIRRLLIAAKPEPDYIDQVLGDEVFCLAEIDRFTAERLAELDVDQSVIDAKRAILQSV